MANLANVTGGQGVGVVMILLARNDWRFLAMFQGTLRYPQAA